MTTFASETFSSDTSYARLRGLIIDAHLLPNTYHLESTLSEKLGLTPDAIHFAATRLESDGLVKTGTCGGFWIAPLPIAQVLAVFKQVSMLEARAAGIAAAAGPGPIALSALYDAVWTMEDALYRGDAMRWAGADHRFHRSLVQASNTAPLIASALPLSEPVHRARMVALTLCPPPFESAQKNAELINAIRRGDPTEAHDLHLTHWKTTAMKTTQLLTDHGLDRIAA